MSENFDFEALIAGIPSPDLFEVPLYRVLHQDRINELNEQIRAAKDPKPGDLRETTIDNTPELTAERDRLEAEQEASAQWFELRGLTAEEFEAVPNGPESLVRQIAAQSQGTRNPLTFEQWVKVKAKVKPGAWFLFAGRANEIVQKTLVVPDFSLTSSKTPLSSSES